MSDQSNTTTATDTANDKVDAAMAKFHAALHDHEELTKGELTKLHRELSDTLAEAQAADKREKDELREHIARVSKWIDDEEKSRAEKDKVRSSSSTIVTPPADFVPPPPAEPHEEAVSGDEGGGRKGWKKLW